MFNEFQIGSEKKLIVPLISEETSCLMSATNVMSNVKYTEEIISIK